MPSPETPFPLPALLDLTRADALQQALQQRLAHDHPLNIDGSAVERVGTACVQVLVAAAIAARGNGRVFDLAAPSDVLDQAVRDLGLATMLGLEAA